MPQTHIFYLAKIFSYNDEDCLYCQWIADSYKQLLSITNWMFDNGFEALWTTTMMCLEKGGWEG